MRLSVARLQTLLRPFHRIVAGWNASDRASEDCDETKILATAIRRAARIVPFRALCFEKALALHAMTKARHGALTVHYGLARNEGGSLRGHVWVECAGEMVLGGDIHDRFELLATFPPKRADTGASMPKR